VSTKTQRLAVTVETCALCGRTDMTDFQETDSLPLCSVHWSRWLVWFMERPDYDAPTPPCGAHLIEVTR